MRVVYFVNTVKSDFARRLLGKKGTIVSRGPERSVVQFDHGETRTIRNNFLRPVAQAGESKKEGLGGFVSQTTNKLNLIARKMLDKDLKALIEAGFLNADLSVRDVNAVIELQVTQADFKKELAEIARKQLDEQEEKSSKKSK